MCKSPTTRVGGWKRQHAALLRLGRDDLKILHLGSFDCSKGNRRIEGRQPPLVRYYQSKQIYVGDLTMALNVIPSEASPIYQANGIRPEYMSLR